MHKFQLKFCDEEHKDEDGFLYVTYSGENTFGGERASDEDDEASVAR